jgi:hypothetical protein
VGDAGVAVSSARRGDGLMLEKHVGDYCLTMQIDRR